MSNCAVCKLGKQASQRIIITSNGIDVIALLIRYIMAFFSKRVDEIWITFGSGDKGRFIPLHILLDKLDLSSGMSLSIVF